MREYEGVWALPNGNLFIVHWDTGTPWKYLRGLENAMKACGAEYLGYL